MSLYSAITCMCRHEEEFWEESSDPRPFFCGLVMLENHNVMYISVGYLSLYSAISCMCRHEEELWEEASHPRALFVCVRCYQPRGICLKILD